MDVKKNLSEQRNNTYYNSGNINRNEYYDNLRKSAYEKIINGANLVQLYTGMVYQGPNIASKITKELIEITKNHSVKNISELVGIKK